MTPLLSILTVTRNGGKFLETCLRNVAEQNCGQAEHIVLDGASTDGSVALLEQLAPHLPRLRWTSEPDSGQSDGMNKGIRMARGRLISFLNVDDRYDPGILNHVVHVAKTQPDPVILAGNCRQVRPDGSVIWIYRPAGFGFAKFLAYPEGSRFPINPCSYFYSRSLHDRVGLYDETDHATMDLDFLLRAVRHARYVHEDRIWGEMLWHAESKTHALSESNQAADHLARTAERHLRACPPVQRWAIRSAQAIFPRFVRARRRALRAAYALSRRWRG